MTTVGSVEVRQRQGMDEVFLLLFVHKKKGLTLLRCGFFFFCHALFELFGRQADDILVLMGVEIVPLGRDFFEDCAAGQDIGLPGLLCGFEGLEFRHHFAGKQVEAVADGGVAGFAGLVEQDDLIDMGIGEHAQLFANGVRRSDQAVAQSGLGFFGVAPGLVFAPHLCTSTPMDASTVMAYA